MRFERNSDSWIASSQSSHATSKAYKITSKFEENKSILHKVFFILFEVQELIKQRRLGKQKFVNKK